MSSSGDDGLEVRGGVGGTAANYEDMESAANVIDDISFRMATLAATLHRFLLHPDLLASAVLNPEGFVAFEAELLGALDGPGGLTTTAAGIGVRAIQLRAAVLKYKATDEVAASLMQVKDLAQGSFAALDRIAAIGRLDVQDLGADLQRIVTDHPGMVDAVVTGVAGFLSFPAAISALTGGPVGLIGKSLFGNPVPQGAATLAVFYPEGRPEFKDLGVDREGPLREPPRGVSDLMAALDYRNEKAKGCDQGQIDVRIVERTMSDGSKQTSYIVDIPGTKSWQVNPAGERTFLNDLGTNLHALAGDETAYQLGVERALREAGAKPGDPVMLVGHSQGGMVAMRAANDFVTDGSFNVTHVVTAGSPVADMPVPDSVQVLSLENEHDIVPHLDGRENPDAPNRTTVTFDKQHGNVGENHGLGRSYEPAAKQLDVSTDPSVEAYRDGADALLKGDSIESHAYQVSRKDPQLDPECKPEGK